MFQVTEAGKETLPSWLYYDAASHSLRGIPSQEEAGTSLFIQVQAMGQFSNDTLSTAKDVFALNIVEDGSHSATSATPLKEAFAGEGMKPIRCPDGSSVTMVTIIVDTDLGGIGAEDKVGMLHGLCSHLSIPPELPRLMPVGNRPMFDSSALVAGPGDVKKPRFPGAVVQWEVGCGNVNANHMPVLQTVEATAHDGSMSNAVGHGIIGWHVTNNKMHAPHRMKRQAAIQPTPTLQPTMGPPTHQPVPTIVVEESEHPPTRVVPSMASPTFPGEIQPTRTKHRHHHRTKTRGRHHHKTKRPKHSPTKKHHHHKTKYPKTPMPTPTVMPIVPTRVIDVTPTVLDTSMERPQPTIGIISPSMTSTLAILEPSITPGLPPVQTTGATEVLPTRTYIVPEVSTEPGIKPTTADTTAPTDQPIGKGTESPVGTTSPVKPPKPTDEPFNYAPILKNDIDRITVVVGDVLHYKVPRDTFYDFEDGDTENLKLVFLTVDGLTLPRNSWVRFNASTQTLYGLALASHVGRQEYLMAAIDSRGKIARDAFEIVVQRRPNELRINHEFSLTLDLDYRKFLTDVDNRIDVANKLAALYGDPNAEKITVTKIAEGSVIYAWTNNSLPTDTCPKREISELLQYLITPNNSLNQSMVAAMHPYKVLKAGADPRGNCVGAGVPPLESSRPPPEDPGQVQPAPRETSDEDVLITTLIPAIVIAAMLLLAGCIACFLYRKKRKGKMTDADRHTFDNKGIPIIFADELEEKPDPPTKPLILDDEKPPLPPPGYRQASQVGSAPSTPNSDHKDPIETTEDEREDNDMMSPLYQPPPPFTAGGARDQRQPRPRMQHTYRNPPPYVPP